MSLVNDMLRDLEKRKATESANSEGAGATRESMIEPRQSGFKKKDILLLGLFVLVLVLLAYILFSQDQEPMLPEVPELPAKIQLPVNEVLVSTQDDDKHKASSKTAMSKSEIKPVEQTSEGSEVAPKPTQENSKNVVQAGSKELADSKVANQTRTAESVVVPKASKSVTAENVVAPEKKQVRATDVRVSKPVNTSATLKEDSTPKKAPKAQPKEEVLKVVLSPAALDLKAASEAISLFELGKSEEAYSLLWSFVGKHKTNERTMGVLANRLLNDQRLTELSDLLANATAPLSPDLRQVKARWLLIQGKHDAAINLLELDQPDIGNKPEYYALLASLYQRNGQAGKAFEQYSQLIQSNDTVADWWAGLGIAADQLSQARQAVYAYQQALSLPGLNRALEQYVRQRSAALSK